MFPTPPLRRPPVPTVTVTWSEALDEASVPTGAGGFQMRIGNANGPAVSTVSVAGSTVTLSLASAIADGTTNVTLEYTLPRSGAKIRDVAGNDAAAILRGDALAVTVTPDTRAPKISGTPTVDGTTLTVTFDEALDTASLPTGAGGFTATVTRGGNPVSGYTVSGLSLSGSGTVVTLTLAQAVRGGDTLTLAYTKSTPPLQDRASTPNEVANFGGQAVDNITPSVKGLPVFAGAAKAYAIGDRIAVEVEFTEAVSGNDALNGPARGGRGGRREHAQGGLRVRLGQRPAALRIRGRCGRRGYRRYRDPGERAGDAWWEFDPHEYGRPDGAACP